MLKILIVDDEKVIRKGLAAIINDLGEEYQLCGEASNGYEALEQILISIPDLVIADVKMPRMDGVDLIRHLEEKYPDIKKIVLSGFEEFDYVRETMKNGALDYLCKPVDEIQLAVLLEKIHQDVNHEKQKKQDALSLKIKLNESFPLMRDQFLKELVCERRYSFNRDLEKKLAYYNIKPDSDIYFICIVSIDNAAWLYEQKGMEEMKINQFIIRNLAEESVGKHTSFFAFMNYTDLVLVCGATAQSVKSVRDSVAYEIFGNLTQYSKIRFTLVVGSPVTSILQLPDSYEATVRAMRSRFYNVASTMIRIGDPVELGAGRLLPSDMVTNFIHALKNSLEEADREKIQKAVSNFSSQLYVIRPEPYCSVKAFADAYMNLQVNHIRFYEAVLAVYGSDYSYIRTLGLFDTLDKIAEYSINMYTEAAEQMELLSGTKLKWLIQQVKEYIEKHYSEDLTLSKVADAVYVNPNYLSEQFKSQTGENFVDYFTKVRIERAKSLLKDIRFKTYEVGELVGYRDAAYFSRVFKKLVGVSPNEYRNLVILSL